MGKMVRGTMTVVLLAGCLGGCVGEMTGPRAIFLDGAGWYRGDWSVRSGLRRGGFPGPVDRFGWSSLLGPVHDHVTAGKDHPKVRQLTERIVRLRRQDSRSRLVLIGLSAGTSLIVSALEDLPDGMSVDHVVLLSPSVSSRHDLSKSLQHVKGRLYATYSPHDAILATVPSAGLERGPPAGRVGFKPPPNLSDRRRGLYDKVVNLPWRGEYAAYGWDGGHVSVTSAEFIRVVIAPRILEDLRHPLDWEVVAGGEVIWDE